MKNSTLTARQKTALLLFSGTLILAVLFSMSSAKTVLAEADFGIASVISDNYATKDGWPVNLNASFRNSSDYTVLVNLDEDDDTEIVTVTEQADGSGAVVHALNPDGTYVSGWPVNTDYEISTIPAAGDINGDGLNEIILVASAAPGVLIVLDNDGTIPVGWPVTFTDSALQEPMLADVDHDGVINIVLATNDGVNVYNSSGGQLTGWPMTTYDADSFSFADIDGDGGGEIVLADVGLDDIVVLNADGSIRSGWPVAVSSTLGILDNLLTGDFNGDGKDEMIFLVGADSSTGGTTYIYQLNETGQSANGWPVQLSESRSLQNNLSAGDIDGDGNAEIFALDSTGVIYAWHVDGTTVSGWPVTMSTSIGSSQEIVMADLDGDFQQEIILLDGNIVYAFSADGTAATEHTFILHETASLGSTVQLDDLDRDGFAEMIVQTGSTSGTVDVASLEVFEHQTGAAYFQAHWPQASADAARTHHFNHALVVSADELTTNDLAVATISGVVTSGEGAFTVYNDAAEELYTCTVFSSGGINPVLNLVNDRPYVFATTYETPGALTIINPIDCSEVSDGSVSLSDQIDSISGTVSSGLGLVAVNNSSGATLYSCTLFSSGGVVPAFITKDDVPYIVAIPKQNGEMFKLVDARTCLTADSKELSTLAGNHQFIAENISSDHSGTELIIVTKVDNGRSAKIRIFFMTSTGLKQKAETVVALGTKSWKVKVKHSKIEIYKSNSGKVISQLKLIKKTGAFSLKEVNQSAANGQGEAQQN